MEAILILLYLLTGLAILAGLFVGASALAFFFVRVPFASTPAKCKEIIIKEFNLKPGNIFYDLGAGDARFMIEAEKYGAKATGFEVAAWAYFRAKLNLLKNKSQAQLYFKNFYSHNLSSADAVFCFLIDSVMSKVEKKLLTELKPGTPVISYGFKMPTWQPERIIEIPLKKRHGKAYLYITPGQ